MPDGDSRFFFSVFPERILWALSPTCVTVRSTEKCQECHLHQWSTACLPVPVVILFHCSSRRNRQQSTQLQIHRVRGRIAVRLTMTELSQAKSEGPPSRRPWIPISSPHQAMPSSFGVRGFLYVMIVYPPPHATWVPRRLYDTRYGDTRGVFSNLESALARLCEPATTDYVDKVRTVVETTGSFKDGGCAGFVLFLFVGGARKNPTPPPAGGHTPGANSITSLRYYGGPQALALEACVSVFILDDPSGVYARELDALRVGLLHVMASAGDHSKFGGPKVAPFHYQWREKNAPLTTCDAAWLREVTGVPFEGDVVAAVEGLTNDGDETCLRKLWAARVEEDEWTICAPANNVEEVGTWQDRTFKST